MTDTVTYLRFCGMVECQAVAFPSLQRGQYITRGGSMGNAGSDTTRTVYDVVRDLVSAA